MCGQKLNWIYSKSWIENKKNSIVTFFDGGYPDFLLRYYYLKFYDSIQIGSTISILILIEMRDININIEYYRYVPEIIIKNIYICVL